jgi:hypothetical protein
MVDPARPGIVRFDDDPTAGILVGMMAAEVVKRWNDYRRMRAILLLFKERGCADFTAAEWAEVDALTNA